MNTPRTRSAFLPSFLGSLCVGIMTAAPVHLARADDTEIYTGNIPSLKAVRPNVLFILDTSGSMRDRVDVDKDGTVESDEPQRMTLMKRAFNNILDDAQGVNFGLMRFSIPGGPILYSPSDVNFNLSTTTATAGDFTVSKRVGSGEDDASEINNQVTVDGTALNLIYGQYTGINPVHAVWQVASSLDDSFFGWLTNGQFDHSAVSTGFPTNKGNRAETHLGMRFLLPKDTRGATISSATLRLKSADDFAHGGGTRPTMVVRPHAVDNSAAFPANDLCTGPTLPVSDPECRFYNQGGSTVSKSIHDLSATDVFEVDVTNQVREITTRPGWHAGAAATSGLSLLARINPGPSNKLEFKTFDLNLASAPELEVDYSTETLIPAPETVGLRFRDLQVPQGAKILSANIVVTPTADSTRVANIDIYGEASSAPAAFTTTNNDISGRTLTSATVPWNLTASDAWTQNSAVTSPSLVGIVQEMVDRTDWCGGKDMAFIMKWASGTEQGRPVYSYENDATRAAKINIVFDENTSYGAGEGCMRQNISVQVRRDGDDAEETISSRSVDTGGSTINGDTDQLNAVRFTDVPIPRGATVSAASLDVTNYRSSGGTVSAGAGTWTISGQATPNAQGFLETPGDISSRSKFSTSAVTKSMPPASVGNDTRYQITGLEGIIQEIIGQREWEGGNAIALILAPSDGGADFRSFDHAASKAAILRATIEYNVGDLPAGVVAIRTVRHKLRELVDGLSPDGGTPLVDTLYEAGRYFKGEGVYYGKTRGTSSGTQPVTRVSHPDSYTGGNVVRATGCTDANLDASACTSERIDGSPIYKSPIEESCQTNYIVLLTDGQANNNNSVDEIESDYSLTCATKYTGSDSGTNVSSGDKCGPDIAEELNTLDLSSTVDGTNTVQTYTVGFGLNNAFLRDVARRGGGEAYRADDADQLTTVFRTIVGDIIERTTSFTAPALTVNSFNQLTHSNKVYMALFEPKTRRGWPGNVKKYKLCNTVGTHSKCKLGAVIDADDETLVDSNDVIKPSSRSEWATVDDGDKVQSGGAAAEIAVQPTRTIYTWLDATKAPQAQTAANRSLAQHKLVDSNDDGAIDNIGSFTTGNALDATRALLTLDSAATAANVSQHIDWIRGVDMDDEDADGNSTERRYSFGDPIHSEPQAVTFGAVDKTDPENTNITKVFLGSNDGGLRMLNAYSGQEEWMFLPQSVLPAQRDLRDNRVGDHTYGMDGTPTIWRRDHNKNGYIEPATPEFDFVRLFTGMRRGGNAYYALDVTPAAELTNRTTAIVPKLMWRIEGGTSAYPRLGQSWSRPLLATIRVGTTTANESILKTVLFISGGYDERHDDYFKRSDSLGNAMYIVDPETGNRLFYVSGTPTVHGAGDGVTAPGMVYPVPSDLMLMDGDGDRAVDRVYFGDTGGQVWRVDLKPNLGTTAGMKGVVGRLASLSFAKTADPAKAAPPLGDQRRIFYAPDVVRIRKDTDHSNTENYNLVMLATGNRAHPLDTGVQDRFFALRDFVTGPLADTGTLPGSVKDDGLADGYGVSDTNPAVSAKTIQGKLASGPVDGDLVDRTSMSATLTGTELTALKAGKGFFVNLTQGAEKGLSSPITLEGKVFLTTYVPEAGTNAATPCQPAEGYGRLYSISVHSGKAIKAIKTLGSGIPSAPVPVFQQAIVARDPNDPTSKDEIYDNGMPQVTLLIGTGGGVREEDPGTGATRRRMYWYEEGSQ